MKVYAVIQRKLKVKKDSPMLLTLISLVLFGTVYYFLWSLWCRYAPTLIAPNAPNWVKRPNFFLFFFVTLIVLLLYRGLARR
ncbi:MAG: putative membrane protein [Rhodoferax sp.]|jgi:uncharacterized membrane protein